MIRGLIASTPFVMVVIPLIVGVVLTNCILVPYLLVLGCAMLCYMLGYWFVTRRIEVALVYIFCAIMCSGYVLASVIPYQSVDRNIPYELNSAQSWAKERLDRLDISEGGAVIAEAMSIGVKSEIPKELKSKYAKVGVSHILAVSGLHVGMVFLLINCCMFFFPLLGYRAHLIKHILAVILIWGYAYMSGVSPSEIRAAIMFSLGQFALATSRDRSLLNIILAAASVMIVIYPHYIYELSFQLSFIATLSIALLFKPIYEYVKGSSVVMNVIYSAVIISVVCWLGSAPIIAYYFGRIPLLGLVINVPIIATAYVILLVSLCWIVVPLDSLNGVVSYVLERATALQNYMVEAVANHPWASVEVVMDRSSMVCCYLLMILIVVGLFVKKEYLCSDDDC